MNSLFFRITGKTMFMIKNIALLLFCTILFSCGKEVYAPKEGSWRASLDLGEGKKLPFLAEYRKDNTLVIFNAEEEIEVTDITIEGDSITIQMPIYEGVFKGVFSEETISGDFIKATLNRVVPFLMEYGSEARFKILDTTHKEIEGDWEMVFSPGSEDDSYIAKGVFSKNDGIVTGTIRTTTGDYRYLEGVIDGARLKLSTFDGAHAFLFEAEIKDSILNGIFYSGNHWKEPFTGKCNANYELPAADSLTFLKEGYEKLEFSFSDTEGNMVSLKDERFKDKVVLVQIMGTWCPNCLDETKFYTQYYNDIKSGNLEIVGLAFEYAPTEKKAINSINRLVDGVGVPYPVLLAQYGTSSKKKANEKLPMLNHVLSYPTTIYIDKTGKVRKIHTGFNGPATGEKYTKFVAEFESFVDQLIEE